MLGETPSFRSFIDLPRTAHLSDRRITIRGWCYHRAGANILAVRVRLKRSVRTGTYGLSRPDVEAAFGEPGSSRSGFAIPVTLTPRHCVCRLEAQLQNGRWHLVRVLTFQTPSRSLLEDGVHWARARGPVPWHTSASVAHVEDAFFRSFIEHPTIVRLAEHRVVIRGWCYHRAGEKVLAVRARAGRHVRDGTHGMARPDVAAVFGGPTADQSGFEIETPLTPNRCDCRLEAQLADGGWRVFQILHFDTPTRSLLHDVARWITARRPISNVDPESRTLAAATGPFRSHLDQPATSRVTDRRTVIRGWCYHRGGATIVGVRARVGRSIYAGTSHVARPDVEAAFNERSAAQSGFEIALAVKPRRSQCRLEVQTEDGRWHLFRALSVETPARARPFQEAWRWGRFWWRAWVGNPHAWDLVSPAEQEYLIARATGRRWLPTDFWNHYPPRRVRFEEFPAPRLDPGQLPAFAIVTPSFNQAAFVEATMRSVLDQAGVRVDYVVQDGLSPDGSADVIRKVAKRCAHLGAAPHGPRLVHWSSAPDAGQADAILKGFEHTRGGPDDLMAYLNSDDQLMPKALRFVAEYFARHPEVDAVYGHRVLIDDAGDEIGRWYSPRRSCDDLLRFFDFVPQETLFWRRRIWDRVGGLDDSFHFALDWDLLLRFQAVGARITRLPWFLGLFRVHGGQKSQAWLDDVGMSEMRRLRVRTFGQPPTDEVLTSSWRRARFDSALVHALFRRGIRA
jgi:hypothetical protein